MKYPVWLPPLLGFLTAVGPISTDMYLPSFPSIEASFGTAPGTAQITLASWFLGLAVGQMTQGTLSDRYGRRWPLLVGTGIYTIASAGCALSPDLAWLTVWRAVAAFGGSASMVIPRAVVRDLADGHAAARLMSQLMLVMGAAPILAPTLGGAVLGFANWHMIFWIAFAYGLVCIALVLAFLPDTLPEQRRVKLGLGGLIVRFAGIGRERTFLTHATVGGFSMFAMFAYLGGSPGVFIEEYHVTPEHYGMLFGTCAAGFILGSQINARILPRFGLNRTLRVATRVLLFATVLLVARGVHGSGRPVRRVPSGGAGDDGQRLPRPERGGGCAVAPCRACGERLGVDGHGAVPARGAERFAGRPADGRHGAADGDADADRRDGRGGCRFLAAARMRDGSEGPG